MDLRASAHLTSGIFVGKQEAIFTITFFGRGMQQPDVGGNLSSQTRYGTWATAGNVPSPNHETTRELPRSSVCDWGSCYLNYPTDATSLPQLSSVGDVFLGYLQMTGVTVFILSVEKGIFLVQM